MDEGFWLPLVGHLLEDDELECLDCGQTFFALELDGECCPYCGSDAISQLA